jgi:hypothetical protein
LYLAHRRDSLNGGFSDRAARHNVYLVIPPYDRARELRLTLLLVT